MSKTFTTMCLTFPICLSTALKKPAITQKHDEAPDAVVGAGAGPGVGAADGPGGQGLSLDQPRLQQDRVDGRAAVIAPQGIVKQADKTVVFEEDNKAGIKADELGEQQRQLQGTECTTSMLFVLIMIVSLLRHVIICSQASLICSFADLMGSIMFFFF